MSPDCWPGHWICAKSGHVQFKSIYKIEGIMCTSSPWCCLIAPFNRLYIHPYRHPLRGALLGPPRGRRWVVLEAKRCLFQNFMFLHKTKPLRGRRQGPVPWFCTHMIYFYKKFNKNYWIIDWKIYELIYTLFLITLYLLYIIPLILFVF